LLRITSAKYSAAQLEARLRNAVPGQNETANAERVPVLARISEGRLTIDLRTVFPSQEAALIEALAGALTAALA
jgi:hypothetical protein